MSPRAPSRLAPALLVALACATSSPLDEGELPLQLHERQVIVALPLLTPDLLADTTRQLARAYDLSVVKGFPLSSIDVHCVVFEVEAGRSVEEVLEALSAHPGVRLVQRNQPFRGLATSEAAPDADPYAEFQHGMRAVRADRVHGWSRGRGVRVALVDTGVDREHPDLRERVLESRNFVQGGDESFTRDAHGTAVAGVIAAGADNGVGIFGVAPESQLIVAKACWQAREPGAPARCSSWTLARAIDYAIAAKARVLNLSLTGPPDPLVTRVLASARDRGLLIVAAADADEPAPGFPASLDYAIAVVASDAEGRVPEPRWRQASTLAAPGEEILTTAPDRRYAFHSGASLSTAYVAGAAALLLEQEPALTAHQLRELLRRSARPGSGAAAGGIGLLDVCAATRELSAGERCPLLASEAEASRLRSRE